MPIYDNNGTANSEIGIIYDNNGTANSTIGFIYDNNGTANSLVYQAQTERTQEIYNISTHAGWWSVFGASTVSGGYRHYGGNGEYFSPFIDLTNYTKITITLFVQLSNGGNVSLGFGFCPQSNPNSYVWSKWAGSGPYGSWQGPALTGTYDISDLKGIYRIKQQTLNGPDTANTYLGNSYFTYLE